jgi:NAD(P)-dependent dehydrogenase (short-subunit alcohol dehydrogenase family)
MERPMKDLNGKTAFITGGASGIGLAMAEAFGREGMNIVLADVESAALAAAVERLATSQIPVHGVIADVTRRTALQNAAKDAVAAFGNLHLVCNNAGVAGGGPIGQVPEHDWDWIVDVNLKGVVYGMEVFAPLVWAHGEGGHFVNTASIAGMISVPTMEPYSATKAAVVSMSEAWAAQLAPRNIGVSILMPGFVRTRIQDSRRNRPQAYGDGEPPALFAETAAQMVANGMPVEPVAARVVEAVRDNELYVFTNPEFKPMVEMRFATILAAFDAAARSPALTGAPPPGPSAAG